MKKIKFLCCTAAVIAAFAAMSVFAKPTDSYIYGGETITNTVKAQKTDKYTFEADADNGYVTIEIVGVQGVEEDTNPTIELSISSGSHVFSKIKTEKNFFDKDYVIAEGLKKGTYTVKVENLSTYADAEYTIKVDFTEYDYVENESNDTPEKANPITLSKTYTGGVSGSEDKDYYSFEVADDGYINLLIRSKAVKSFTLYNDNLEELNNICFALKDTDKFLHQRIGLSKGKYYLCVSSEENGTYPLYDFSVTAGKASYFESEPNNTVKQANTVSLSKEYYGDITGAEDADIYKFTLSGKDDVTVKFYDQISSSAPHYSIYILDSDGKVIAQREKTNTADLTATLDAGTYYFEVNCPSERYYSNLGYRFKINTKLTHESTDKPSETETPEKPEKPETPDTPDTPTEPDNGDKEPDCTTPVFSDVQPGQWFYNDVQTAYSQKLVNGVGDNKYDPYGKVSLAQIITVAARIHSADNGVEFDFDKQSNVWYSNYVAYAVAANIIKTDDFDDYTKSATRAQTAYILANALGLDSNAQPEAAINDVDANTEYLGSILAMYAKGFLQGDADGNFRPSDSLNRAELAAIIVRIK